MGVFSHLIDSQREPSVAAGGQVRATWQPLPDAMSEQEASPFAPVRGVTLELFADIVRLVASRQDASAQGIELAARRGISAPDWLFAARTWNARSADHEEVARRLSARYRASARASRAS